MILFRTEAATDIGFAHLHRCLLLAAALRGQGAHCVFAVAQDDTAQAERVKQSGFVIAPIPSACLYADEARNYPDDVQVVLIDLQHTRNIADPSRLLALLHGLKKGQYKVVFLDAMFDEAFRHKDAPKLYAYVQPYVGAEQDTRPDCDHWLTGASYAIMTPTYRNLPQRHIKHEAKNILVTFGGADPQNLTATLLNALKQRHDLALRVIQGPYFSDDHKNLIAGLAAYARAEIIDAPASLLQHYQWADIAIGSSGLSRYEFAATGLPSLFCALYSYHVRTCHIFSETGAARYLGYYKDIGDADWEKALDQLIGSPPDRQSMGVAGQALIDGKGADRILSDLQLL